MNTAVDGSASNHGSSQTEDSTVQECHGFDSRVSCLKKSQHRTCKEHREDRVRWQPSQRAYPEGRSVKGTCAQSNSPALPRAEHRTVLVVKVQSPCRSALNCE